MRSIETIKNHIKMLEENILIAKENENENYIPYFETDLRKYKEVLQDLEMAEIIKNKIHFHLEFDVWQQEFVKVFVGVITEEEKEKLKRWKRKND